MIDAYIIPIRDNPTSHNASSRLVRSIDQTGSKINVHVSNAVTPSTLKDTMTSYFGNSPISNIRWTYPTDENENRLDIGSGLKLSAYATASIDKRISCLMSHYVLWYYCAKINKPIMILEHDALFTREFNYDNVKNKFTGQVLGLNSPYKATRRASVFNDKVTAASGAFITDPEGYNQPDVISQTPWVDDHDVPQGIAGNSAYILKPKGAIKLMELIGEHGMWPNDAIMCKQLMGNHALQVVYPYYSTVQGTRSTTTL